MGYDAVIFDNDGVLLTLTSMEAHREGSRDAFARAGVPDPHPDHVEAMSIGVSVAELESICERYDLEPEAFWSTRDAAISAAQQAEMTAGEKRPYDDIDALDKFETPLAVVSSNQQETVEFAFDHFGLDTHFETVYGREPTVKSLERKKPHPHYVERALADLDVEDALFVGDNESDVRAAHGAGIDSAFIRRPHRVDASLSVRPDYEIWGLDDVVDIAE
ncbi:HAD family hydrolase [Halomicroarcula limicola]|uniref:HAD family hydrolase n=1 Tax=Haloarcula limicola TaxID=1429915 RepID=A0A8J7Y4G9_9EURY|nr:HAD family hydrolase [Halomicroarcula limicola]MBV0923827.1 HAD family hydrolase [Halomicroarcula limicola]